MGDLPNFAIHYAEEVPTTVASHIVRHGPARVLAEVETKRRLIDQHVGYSGGGDDDHWPVQTLRLLALPYASHPDYRPEWRP
ncbi:hypothetical protein E1287_07300 [Actinomadura sp. KC06]|uniref:DUF6221 family protein n=1 Tax=Actinomadura sp. KC06 TaxID=2530369 RepID=UPI00104D2572|nr:DUF6221 family protein [Actinomadura sp. KC06]TDD37855.1 hypothetical protein E1287_07300 [Actinomadura sp. KC06]